MSELHYTEGTELNLETTEFFIDILAENDPQYSSLFIELNSLSNKIIACAIEIHKTLGPGLLESSYRECLYYELKQCGFKVEREKAMPLVYKEVTLEQGYRMDLVVEDKVVIELKAVDSLSDAHFAQVLTYLKLGNYKLGLLLNFNAPILVKGIKRIIN